MSVVVKRALLLKQSTRSLQYCSISISLAGQATTSRRNVSGMRWGKGVLSESCLFAADGLTRPSHRLSWDKCCAAQDSSRCRSMRYRLVGAFEGGVSRAPVELAVG